MSAFFGYTLNVTPQSRSRLGERSRLSSQFFLKPINETACSWDLGEREGWSIQLVGYFVDSAEHATYFACCFSESRDAVDKKGLDEILGPVLQGFDFGETLLKVCWANGSTDEWRPVFSRFLRGSDSLNSRDFIELNSLSFTADGHGVAVVERNTFAFSDRAIRLLHLVSLAGAYFVAMNRATDSLAEAAVNKISSETELRSWTIFLAKYYSSEPVRSTTVELVHFYAALRDRLRIENHYRELTEQLKMHSDIVSFERHEIQSERLREEKRQKEIDRERETAIFNQFQKRLGSLSFRVSLIGLFVAFTGVIFAALTLTPKQVQTATTQWMACYRNSWAHCIKEETQATVPTKQKGAANPVAKPKNVKVEP